MIGRVDTGRASLNKSPISVTFKKDADLMSIPGEKEIPGPGFLRVPSIAFRETLRGNGRCGATVWSNSVRQRCEECGFKYFF